MLLDDLRHSMRGLARRRVAAAGVLVALSLGIALTTVMFSVVSTVLWRPLPYDRPEQVVAVWGHVEGLALGFTEIPIHGRHYTDVRNDGRVFDAVAAFKADFFNLGDVGGIERVDGIRTTAGLFEAVGVRPFLGRTFTIEDETPGRDRVVVLGHSLWRERFDADAGIIGRTIRMNGEAWEVVGVAPPGFEFPRGGEMPGNFQFPARAQLWIPMAPATGGPSDLAMVARVRGEDPVAVASADLERISAALAERLRVNPRFFGTEVVPLRQQVIGGSAPMLLALLAAAVMVMLIACANAAQLLLAEAVTRQREFAVRCAIGASRARLVRQVLTDALVLALLAGGIGVGLSVAGIELVQAVGPERLPRLRDVALDVHVLAFVLALSVATGLLFGSAPAIAGTRADLFALIRSSGRGAVGGFGSRLRSAFLLVEIAVSVVLVAGAGLLLRSLEQQLRVDPGFDSRGVATFEVTLPPAKYPEARSQEPTYLDNATLVAFFQRAQERLAQMPGVTAVSMARPLPLSGAQEATVFEVEGAAPPVPGQTPPFVEYAIIGPDFFRALGVSMVTGREFTGADVETAVPVVIVNSAFARHHWPGVDPIGRRMKLPPPNRPWMTVVGIAPDVKQFALTEASRPIMYVPFTQRPYAPIATSTLILRTAGAPLALIDDARAAVAELDPDVPIAAVQTMDALVDRVTAEARFAAGLLLGFAVAACALAALGLAGLTAYLVQCRRRELGVRIALGASPGRIFGDVVRDALRIAGLGAVVGVLAALATMRLLEALLFGVRALDPLTLAAAPLILIVIVVLACALPALRATKLDPRMTFDAD